MSVVHCKSIFYELRIPTVVLNVSSCVDGFIEACFFGRAVADLWMTFSDSGLHTSKILRGVQ